MRKEEAWSWLSISNPRGVPCEDGKPLGGAYWEPHPKLVTLIWLLSLRDTSKDKALSKAEELGLLPISTQEDDQGFLEGSSSQPFWCRDPLIQFLILC